MAQETVAPWRIQQGERKTLSAPIIDDNDDPFSVNGWTVDVKIKDRPGGTTLYTFPDEQVTVTGGSTIELLIPAAVSAAWTFTTGWYRVMVSDDDPDDPQAFQVLSGTFVVDPN